MKLSIEKNDKSIKVYINDMEITNIKSFHLQRDEDINYVDITLKVLLEDIKLIDNSKKD